MPARVALAGREVEDFQVMAVRIAEVKRLDATRIGVPVRQPLWSSGSVPDFVPAQVLIRPVHVIDDNGDVLEPAVVATGVFRDGSTLWGEKLHEIEMLLAQSHTDNAQTQAEDAE